MSTNTVRVTMVMNRTGSSIALPTGQTLENNQIAAYALKGTVYVGNFIADLDANLLTSGYTADTDTLGFQIFFSQMAGDTAHIDNIGLWNSLGDTVNGISVLELPFGTRTSESEKGTMLKLFLLSTL